MNSSRAESLTRAVRTNRCFAGSPDVFAEPERGSTVVAAVAAREVADTPRNDSSCSSSPARRALGSWDRGTRTRHRNPDGRRRRRGCAAVNDQGVRTKLAGSRKDSEQKARQQKGGHACDSLDLVDEGSGHLDRHTSDSALGR